MKRVIFRAIFLLIFIASPFCAEDVFACQCFGLPTISQSYENASAVFTGKVAELKINSGQRIFSFQIKENFKGTSVKELKVINGTVGEMCDYGFTVGESYLVYAFSYGEDKKILFTGNFCSRNDVLADAQGEVFFLRERFQRKPESQIYGSVLRRETNQKTSEALGTPLQNIKVLVEGNGKNYETFTDEYGIFRLNKIPKGRYTVKPEFPKIYANSTYPEEQEFLILESGKIISAGYRDIFSQPPYSENETESVSLARGEVSNGLYVGFSLRWNNRVSVKLSDSEGKVIKDAKVNLLPVSVPFREIAQNFYNSRDGNYGFAGLTPGRYYLTAEIDAPFADENRFFYPQTETPEKATKITIKEIENLEFDFNLPVIQRNIEGKIYWSDGMPIVGDVRVILLKSENPSHDELMKNNYDVTTLDGASYFSLKGYVGAEYWIQVKVYSETYVAEKMKITEMKAKPIKIKVEKTNQPLKILIPKPDK